MWLSWLEHCPINQKVASSIPGQGACLLCGFGPQLGHMREATDVSLSHACFSPSLSPSSALSLKSVSNPDQCGSVGQASSTNQKVTHLIPGKGICLSCGPGPWDVCEKQSVFLTSLFLFFSFLLPSSLSKNE